MNKTVAQTQLKSQPFGASIVIVNISLSLPQVLSLQLLSPIIDHFNCQATFQDIDPEFFKKIGPEAFTSLMRGMK